MNVLGEDVLCKKRKLGGGGDASATVIHSYVNEVVVLQRLYLWPQNESFWFELKIVLSKSTFEPIVSEFYCCFLYFFFAVANSEFMHLRGKKSRLELLYKRHDSSEVASYLLQVM